MRTLDAAWRDCEAAMPEGWGFDALVMQEVGIWEATALDWQHSEGEQARGRGPTPIAALDALTAKLREQAK